LSGNAKKTGRPYIMYFATIYDGTTRIDDCILNGAEELNVEEGDLLQGKLHFEEARNKKYSDHTYYLSNIKKIKTTENYDALSKFNIVANDKPVVVSIVKMISRKQRVVAEPVIQNDTIIQQPKMICRKKKTEEPIQVFISRKKKSEPIQTEIKFISRKKNGQTQLG
jgi:hypothetical protein